MGLVEVGVGVVPGWGGCKEMMGRFGQDGQDTQLRAFELISTRNGFSLGRRCAGKRLYARL